MITPRSLFPAPPIISKNRQTDKYAPHHFNLTWASSFFSFVTRNTSSSPLLAVLHTHTSIGFLHLLFCLFASRRSLRSPTSTIFQEVSFITLSFSLFFLFSIISLDSLIRIVFCCFQIKLFVIGLATFTFPLVFIFSVTFPNSLIYVVFGCIVRILVLLVFVDVKSNRQVHRVVK